MSALRNGGARSGRGGQESEGFVAVAGPIGQEPVGLEVGGVSDGPLGGTAGAVGARDGARGAAEAQGRQVNLG